jgi:hypothetical protein
MWEMLRLGWHRKVGARSAYLAYSFLADHEWRRLAYPTRLEVDYRPELMKDVLRQSDSPPTLNSIRLEARRELEGITPRFVEATSAEEELRRQLLDGNLEAFPNIAQISGAKRRKSLMSHPGLTWRLRQARSHSRKGFTPSVTV